MQKDNKFYYFFTDGSSKGNQFKNPTGGFGVYFPQNPELNISKKLEGKVTNNIAELSAVYYGILKLIRKVKVTKPIIIVSDSKYIIDSITKWAKGWEKNNWKKADGNSVQNEVLIKKIYYLVNNLNIKFLHQRAHKSPPKDKNSSEYFFWEGNDKADKLANLQKI